MRRVMKRSPAKSTGKRPRQSIDDEVQSVLKWLKRCGTKRNREGMARYGIRARKVFGVSVTDIRVLTSFVDEPARVTPAQMDRWCRDFDNWAVCDALCFHLFDRTPLAWQKIAKWCDRRDEFVRRAAFALLASLAVHDKRAADAPFIESLALIERAATDERNFVKKAVNWALRAIGKRNHALNAAAVTLARRLTESPQSAARWVGKDALRELTSSAVNQRLETRSRVVPKRRFS